MAVIDPVLIDCKYESFDWHKIMVLYLKLFLQFSMKACDWMKLLIEVTKTNQSNQQKSILISNSDASCNLCLHWYFSHQVSTPRYFMPNLIHNIYEFTYTSRKVNLSQLGSQMQILLSSWQIHFPFRNF